MSSKLPLLSRGAYPTHARPGDLKVGYVAAVVAVHGLAAVAPWHFTGPGLIAFVVLFFLTGPVGINLGFHRLLSHRSFRVHPNMSRCFALLGTLALQGGPISWVGNHRYHHKEADRPLDPHTPLAGFAWAHFTWAFHVHPRLPDREHKARYAPDLVKDRFLRFCEEQFIALNVLQVAILLGAGWLAGGPGPAASILIWGWALRVAFTWHMTFIVNSVNHLWGYRNYETPDNSRNNVWISLLVFGEGWHNNHHADPRSAAHGHRRFEFDMGYAMIRLMEALGIAGCVVRPSREATGRLPGRAGGVEPSPD
jgi:stearoyl-CoA desaturase (delta-9 desaturase)